jgi:hypothetical protein
VQFSARARSAKMSTRLGRPQPSTLCIPDRTREQPGISPAAKQFVVPGSQHVIVRRHGQLRVRAA